MKTTDLHRPEGSSPAHCSHPILAQAGVAEGDLVWWTNSLTLNGVKCEPHACKVIGVHLSTSECNKGTPAVHVVDEQGHGYRAYPGELRLRENVSDQIREGKTL